ncbi:MAG: class I SAM-dependent RNA methyltransferase [Treponema sp.]|nr:class I SAM-dependent RNA methyltransferase [Treponema sp.]
MAVGDIIKLRFESVAQGGAALGRFEGKNIFAEGGAPDEEACCRITEEHNSWARASILEITEPSPDRVQSGCVFYGKCGGCNLQHINYEAQLKIKSSILKESFLRIGSLDPPQPDVVPSLPFEYRNRMQFHIIRQTKGSGYSIGLKSRASAEVTAVSDCPVAVSGIREVLKSITLHRGHDSQSGKLITLPPEKDRFTIFSKDDVLLNDGGVQKGKIKLLDADIQIDTGLFFQSNCVMLEKLITKLRETAETADRSLPMADLYCGAGTFAFFLRDLFPKIILAEENKNAVSLARENLKGACCEFFALRDTEWQKSILRRIDRVHSGMEEFGFAVVDPPRAGLSAKLSSALSQEGPAIIAYVSCDAASLARDAKILVNGGYHLEELTLFDFYPQTAHIESLAVFTKD